MLVICSPCNPVGAAITLDDLDRLLRAASADTLVVLDEAYVEFMDDATRGQHFKRLKAHDGPWMALRTFSKAYGLAGLRIGYGIAHHPALAAAVYKVRSPFNVSATALAGAEAAYGDQDHVGASIDEHSNKRHMAILRSYENRCPGILPGQGASLDEHSENLFMTMLHSHQHC